MFKLPLAVGVAGLALWSLGAQDAVDPGAFRAVIGVEDTLLFRGQAALTDRSATVRLPSNIDAVAKAEGATIVLTCKGSWSPLWATPVSEGTFKVFTTEAGNPTQSFWWEIKVGAKTSAFGFMDK